MINIESRKKKKTAPFPFFFFLNEKREFSLNFSFSFRDRKINKQLEYSISTCGWELNAPFCWLVSWRSKRAVISSSTVFTQQNNSPPLLLLYRLLTHLFQLHLIFFHQTNRLMNSSTQLVPGQSLDRAFFCVDINYLICISWAWQSIFYFILLHSLFYFQY